MNAATDGDLSSCGDHDPDAGGPTNDALPPLVEALEAAIAGFDPGRRLDVARLSRALMDQPAADHVEERCLLLIRACFYFHRIGCSFDGIASGKAALDLAARHGLRSLERRACDALSGVYLDTANFVGACECLERTLVIAHEIGDPFLISAAYSTTGALFKALGWYADAMALLDRAIDLRIATPQGEQVRFSCASNGLYCAHRLSDDAAALRYMSLAAAAADNPLIDVMSRAVFEYDRAIYLLSNDDGETAEMLIDAALDRTVPAANARVDILLGTAAALCAWSSRIPEREIEARRSLRELYHRSRRMHVHHDDVLRASMQVYSRPCSREDAEVGVAFGKELVAYTTSVKHARFYRQMSESGVPVRPTACPVSGLDAPGHVDPLPNAHRGLATARSAPAPPAVAGDRAGRQHFRGPDELTAIRDDLATIPAHALKASMRTVAYDMAENWALAAELLDDRTGQHCFRVGRLAGMLAAELGLGDESCVRIEHAARLHDIGKITVNELILLKPGPLDPNELTAMRAHAEVGGILLQDSDDPTLTMAAVIARHHHEWWNGTGYPDGLAGECIPLEARICALADRYDTLTNVFPYKRAWSHRTSIEQMMCESGVHFDPRLMVPFLRALGRYIGSNGVAPSSRTHLRDMDANGLVVSRRKLMAAIDAAL